MRGAYAIGRKARRLMGTERPIVLMYHRVETLALDPWQLAVKPDRFAAQIARLMDAREVVPLSWLGAQLQAGRLPRRVACVTFDDGYGDVFRNAWPILERMGCPATVFMATGELGGRTGFWWDRLARLVLETETLPETLAFDLAGTRHAVSARGDRNRVLAEVHAILRPAPSAALETAMDAVTAQAGGDASLPARDLTMSAEQMVAMAASGLVEIGAHTVTHPAMTAHAPATQVREAEDSRRRCEELLGRPVKGFAYPYGDHDATAMSSVAAAGLTHACTVEPRAVLPGTDPLAIPRFLAADWDTETFERRVLSHA